MKVNPQSPSWIRPTVAGILGAVVTVVVAMFLPKFSSYEL